MTTIDFTTTIMVDQTPNEVFNAINNVRGWWSAEIEGDTDKLNDVFNYHFEDIHRCQIKLIAIIPEKKVVWHVMDNYFKPGIFNNISHPLPSEDGFDKTEWIDTTINFAISQKAEKTQICFTHLGLVPEYECFDLCATSWNHYIEQSLFKLITTGKGEPNPVEESERSSAKAATL